MVFNNRLDINTDEPDAGMKTIFWNNGLLTLDYCFDSVYKEGICLSFVDTTGNLIWKKIFFHPVSNLL